MSKLKALFHPIFIFIGVQVAWIVLMAVWINWYLKNSRKFQEFAQKIRPDLFADEFYASAGVLCREIIEASRAGLGYPCAVAAAVSMNWLRSARKAAVASRSRLGSMEMNGRIACSANATTLAKRRQAMPMAKIQCSK